MSRLLVKNLPFHVTPAKLKEHFEQRGGPGGVITDFKVASKPDGTSRRFGFVGYKTDKDAQAAKDWFDKTFIGSTRIHVTIVDVRYPLLLSLHITYLLIGEMHRIGS